MLGNVSVSHDAFQTLKFFDDSFQHNTVWKMKLVFLVSDEMKVFHDSGGEERNIRRCCWARRPIQTQRTKTQFELSSAL